MSDKVIEFEGLSFTIPEDVKELPLEAVEAFEDDRHIAFVRALVGPEAWGEFKDRNPSLADFGRLADAIGQQYGFSSVGESVASGPSSEPTPDPSRPTSNGSTDWTLPQSVSTP